MKTLAELFEVTVRDILRGKSHPESPAKMAKKASSPDLRAAFTEHLEQTKGHVERLEQVFQMIGKTARGKKCDAIEGLTAEADEIVKEAQDDTVRDAGMLGSTLSSTMKYLATAR